jgi:hypothetical protein
MLDLDRSARDGKLASASNRGPDRLLAELCWARCCMPAEAGSEAKYSAIACLSATRQ